MSPPKAFAPHLARHPMRLSVVIPTLNEAENAAACVASGLGLAPGWSGAVEVIVADGGSTDGTPDVARAAGATVIDTQRGRGSQVRAGVRASSGEVVLVLHADTRLDRGAGAQLAAALGDPRVVCGAFRQRIDAPGLAFRLLEAGNAFRARRLGTPYGDQAVFARRAALDAVGGVPDLPLMEDVELMRRLRRVGWPVLLDGPLVVSARRWRRHGVVGQTLRNWSLLAAYGAGVPAERLARWYRPHRSAPAPAAEPTEAVT